jgi:uncharacterized protein YdeI (YjbR/CyaY-like superfamily)
MDAGLRPSDETRPERDIGLPEPEPEEAMGTRDPRIDAYIAKSPEFAKPILTHLREVIHSACPDVEETMKWSAPTFMYHGMLANMAAFKHHCAFGFWKGSLVFGEKPDTAEEAAGQFGRITKVSDLPPKKILAAHVKKAMELNEQGVKVPPRMKKRRPAAEVEIPDALTAALQKNRKALATFESFSPSHRREYADWIAEAKREETRQRRVETAVEWMAEGKPRHWKHM